MDPAQVVCRLTGVELSQAASSAPVACRATVWIHNTTATVTLTAWSGKSIYRNIFTSPFAIKTKCFYRVKELRFLLNGYFMFKHFALKKLM